MSAHDHPRDNELGVFLRTRREAVTPAAVGLPTGPRRRTPGLRRAELATLAGVSVEYLTRLEQGRDRHPSPSVLAALAQVLGLTTRERVHLHRLTKAADPGFSCVAGAPLNAVRPTVRALLARLEPSPALVLNRVGDVLAHTDGYRRLAEPIGLLDGDPPNHYRFVLADERARDVYPDWELVADDQVATLKQGPFRSDAHLAPLVDELTLTAGAGFTERVARVAGPPRSSAVRRLRHPEAGELRLAHETLDLSDDDQRLVVLLPADDATAAALDGLTGRHPGALRAV
ncbi:helix-turn-helix domain-containing protein [Streptomyces hainanensis]|uniref:XRE family transcriptional regulator n=1 Tax=Streptomyces hainanensis TaxID=402648 RepID=A0A4R4TCV8_9ACTN|nr:helix-turn-helix transcriptional regulator [Streptomyces hainanensis]TDC75137.1 XRE family transcriptional regulator [Streptomyces hainanensis]